jgi:hypothetical protein
MENIAAEGEGDASAGEKENIDPVANVVAVVVDGGNKLDGVLAGPSGVEQARAVPAAAVDVGDVLGSIPADKLIEICLGAVQRMGTLQCTEFAGHFSGVLANDANAFGPIIQVSSLVMLFISCVVCKK